VRDRAAAGKLHRLHQGVYAVGHTVLKAEGRTLAAVLACGAGTVTSHRTAARLHNLRPDNRALVDVIAPGRAGRSRKGIRVHRGMLIPEDITTINAIPSTSVARTLIDLAAELPERAVEKACNQAEILRVFDLTAIDQLLARAGGHTGAARLRAVLQANRFLDTFTENDLEEAMFGICRSFDLPQPKSNYWIGNYKADFAWPEYRLIVETDGYASHSTRRAFKHDRQRDRQLLREWRVARFTHDEVMYTPATVGRELAGLLTR
jgi:very-short-patch-repair endonuclease